VLLILHALPRLGRYSDVIIRVAPLRQFTAVKRQMCRVSFAIARQFALQSASGLAPEVLKRFV
jgi:hypothetical protein